MKKVFVVEDIKSDAEALCQVLNDLNYKVKAFNPKAKFVDQLINSKADIVFISAEHYHLREHILKVYRQIYKDLTIVIATRPDSAAGNVLPEQELEFVIQKPYYFGSVYPLLNRLSFSGSPVFNQGVCMLT